MATPQQPFQPITSRRAAIDVDLVRDMAAVACIMAGLTGLIVIAFTVDPLLGLAFLCAAITAAGVALGRRR